MGAKSPAGSGPRGGVPFPDRVSQPACHLGRFFRSTHCLHLRACLPRGEIRAQDRARQSRGPPTSPQEPLLSREAWPRGQERHSSSWKLWPGAWPGPAQQAGLLWATAGQSEWHGPPRGRERERGHQGRGRGQAAALLSNELGLGLSSEAAKSCASRRAKRVRHRGKAGPDAAPGHSRSPSGRGASPGHHGLEPLRGTLGHEDFQKHPGLWRWGSGDGMGPGGGGGERARWLASPRHLPPCLP